MSDKKEYVEIPTHYDELAKFHQSILIHTLQLVIDHLVDDNKQTLEKFGDSSLEEINRLLTIANKEADNLNKLLDETRLNLLRKNPEKCLEYQLEEVPEEFKQLWLYLNKKKQDKEFIKLIKDAINKDFNKLRKFQSDYTVPDYYFDYKDSIHIRPIY